jgi:putative oxidoreductase
LIQSTLFGAGLLSFIASVTHIGIVIRGPAWYRFFGAGERMARLAEEKSIKPILVTLSIALVLFLWGLYAWSGAGVIPQLPLLKPVLVLVTSVYLLRGIVGLVAPYVSNHPAILSNSKRFWFWSSLICLGIGLMHLLGLVTVWVSL